MDDELKAIQGDLDSVLERLADYMNSEGSDKHDSVARNYKKPDAARVALHYVSTKGDALDASINSAEYCHDGLDRNAQGFPKGCRLREHPAGNEGLSDLIEALRALESWIVTRWPLEDSHTQALAFAVNAWSQNECQFIGENVGLTLTPKRLVDWRKLARESAAEEVYVLNLRDPEAYPIGEALFEQVGQQFGMSAKTVSRAYYSKDAKMLRGAFDRAFGPGAPPMPDKDSSITVGEWLQDFDWSKKDGS